MDLAKQQQQQQQPPHANQPPVPELPTVLTTAKVDKAQLDGIAAAQAAEQLAKAEEKRRKKEAAGTGTKKISIQLQKWNTKQVELNKEQGETLGTMGVAQGADHGHAHDASASRDDRANSTSTVAKVAVEEKKKEDEEVIVDTDDYDPSELEDVELMACMLCQRRFKGIPELKKHQDFSDLHKKNLQDKEAIRAALIKTRTKRGLDLAKGHNGRAADGVSTLSQAGHEQEGDGHERGGGEPKYRDRAAERRLVYGQPDNPHPPSGHRHGGSGQHARGHRGSGGGSHLSGSLSAGGFGSGGSEGAIVPDQPTKDGIKEDNIGNRLLKSMGWKEGQGLGKDGGGITAPVEATSYSRGAGIGAGVLFKGDQHTRGYAETAKEIARRRYEEDRN
ncbi:RNA-binding protein 5 [Actinomortierella ambigua]|nr:RNA-binding protein 5 [Actinomortierella ambigua]